MFTNAFISRKLVSLEIIYKMKKSNLLSTFIGLALAYGCPKQITINGDEFQLDLFDSTYKSSITGNTIARDRRNAKLDVWIYFRKNYPVVSVTNAKCPTSDSNWFQWDAENAKYIEIRFNTDYS